MVNQFLDLLADGLSDTRNASELLSFADCLRQWEGQLVYGPGSALVGANLEYRVALHLQHGA